MKLWDLLVQSAGKALAMQSSDGSMPAGHNGPRHDAATPVRNTGHWLSVFIKAHELTGQQVFEDAARRAAGYLADTRSRPHGAAFWCLKDPRRGDTGNGLIGQAWAIEALAGAGEHFNDTRYSLIAREVFFSHRFDEKRGLWHRLAVEAETLPIDVTFNHHLWFAMSAALLCRIAPESQVIRSRVKRFLARLPANLCVYPDGLIGHIIFNPAHYRGIWGYGKAQVRKVKNMCRRADFVQALGYHSFNLYAFAVLKKEGWLAGHDFFSGPAFAGMIRYATTKKYRDAVRHNPYAFGYNPTGFEVALALEAFGQDPARIPLLVNEQIKSHFDFTQGLLCKETVDPDTLSARMYEAVRLPNLDITIPYA